MIDTDKYEGHTEGEWDWFPTPNDSHIGHLQGHSNLTRVTAEIKSRSAEDDANARLIADAPLLLAEVIRLRERLIRAYDWAENAVNGNDSAMMDYTEYVCGGDEE
jgi:hypothetical protein